MQNNDINPNMEHFCNVSDTFKFKLAVYDDTKMQSDRDACRTGMLSECCLWSPSYLCILSEFTHLTGSMQALVRTILINLPVLY